MADTPFAHIDLERHRVDLDPQPAGSLVHQVDGLVGQETLSQVSIRQGDSGNQRCVGDAHAVVDLVALLQPAQDGHRIGDRWLAHIDGRKTPLERSIVFDVLAILVERRRAHKAQLPARQHRLEHVGCVERTVAARARADQRVHLVQERDDLAVGFGDLAQHRFEPFLELAPILGSCHHRSQVQRDDTLVAQAVRNVALGDAAGQAFDDRRLSHARFADQDWVVLGTSRQHLDDPPDLVIAADDGIELVVASLGREVAAESLKCFVAILRSRRRDPCAAAQLADQSRQRIAVGVEVVGERQQQVLGGQVVIAHLSALCVGGLQRFGQITCEPGRWLGLRTEAARQPLKCLKSARTHGSRLDAGPCEHGKHQALWLRYERQQQVSPGELGVTLALRGLSSRCQRLLALVRQRAGRQRALAGICVVLHDVKFSRKLDNE